MARLLLGKEVTAAMNEAYRLRAEALRKKGIVPKLAIIRCGNEPSDLAYEKGAASRAALIGAETVQIALPRDVTKQELLSAIRRINEDDTVHGCLLLRPLPPQLKKEQDEIVNALLPEKDVDGMTDLSAAGVFTGKGRGFAPCTAQACMEILDYYGVDCTGKNAVVIGRSCVVGKPVSMLLLEKNATVTVCHTKTQALASIARQADILISSAKVLNLLTEDFVRSGQVILDVSVNWDASKPNSRGTLGAMAGDADFEKIEPIVAAVTPVPGGVGAVTTSVLIAHTVEAAERRKGDDHAENV